LLPIYQSDTDSGWSGTQSIWTNPTQHSCLNFAGINSSNLSTMTVSSIMNLNTYNPAGSSIPPQIPSQPVPYADSLTSGCSATAGSLPCYRQISDFTSWYTDESGPCAYMAKTGLVSTGLYVQDGDELTISWSGHYSMWPTSASLDTKCSDTDFTKVIGVPLSQALVCGANAATNTSFTLTNNRPGVGTFVPTKPACQKSAALSSGLIMNFQTSTSSNATYVLNGENARTKALFTPHTSTSSGVAAVDRTSSHLHSSYNRCQEYNLASTPISIYGLIGSVADDPSPVLNNPNNSSYSSSCSTYYQTLNSSNCPSGNCALCYYINGSNSDYVFGGIDNAIGTSSSNILNPTYTYSGTIGQNSSGGGYMGSVPSRSLLKISGFDTCTGCFADNTGGQTVNIKWGGCPTKVSDSNVIQYAVASCNLDPTQVYDGSGYNVYTKSMDTITWSMLTLGNVNSINCTEAKCCLYFRYYDPYITQTAENTIGFNTTTPTGNSFPPLLTGGNTVSLKNFYGNAANRFGSFSLSIANNAGFSIPSPPLTGGILQGVIAYINSTIVGTPPNYNDGVIKSFYIAVVSGTSYATNINAFFEFYMAISAILFITGIHKIDLKTLSEHLLKIGFFWMLVTAGGWNTFGSIVLPGIVNGSVNISSAFAISTAATLDSGCPTANPNCHSNMPNGYAQALKNDPSALIGLMVDAPLKYMWGSHILWMKVGALIFSAWWGILFFLVLVLSMIIYSIGLIKITMIYAVTFVGIGVLIFIAPLVIPMMLFEFTSQMFETWWKMLLSYFMQPIMLFAGVSVLNFLTLAVLYSSVSYTICPVCFINIPFFGHNYCLLTIYKLLSAIHNPTQTGFIPANLICSASLFLLLSYAMYEMPSLFTALADQMITGGLSNAGATSDEAFSKVGMDKVDALPATIAAPVNYGIKKYSQMKKFMDSEDGRAVGRALQDLMGGRKRGGIDVNPPSDHTSGTNTSSNNGGSNSRSAGNNEPEHKLVIADPSKAQSGGSAPNTDRKVPENQSSEGKTPNTDTKAPENKSHLEVLGLQPDATPRDIKVAFMKLARTHHPDKGGDADEFKKINTAYAALTGKE
jgi:type IV secretory pathway VirB6-like protein